MKLFSKKSLKFAGLSIGAVTGFTLLIVAVVTIAALIVTKGVHMDAVIHGIKTIATYSAVGILIAGLVVVLGFLGYMFSIKNKKPELFAVLRKKSGMDAINNLIDKVPEFFSKFTYWVGSLSPAVRQKRLMEKIDAENVEEDKKEPETTLSLDQKNKILEIAKKKLSAGDYVKFKEMLLRDEIPHGDNVNEYQINITKTIWLLKNGVATSNKSSEFFPEPPKGMDVEDWFKKNIRQDYYSDYQRTLNPTTAENNAAVTSEDEEADQHMPPTESSHFTDLIDEDDYRTEPTEIDELDIDPALEPVKEIDENSFGQDLPEEVPETAVLEEEPTTTAHRPNLHLLDMNSKSPEPTREEEVDSDLLLTDDILKGMTIPMETLKEANTSMGYEIRHIHPKLKKIIEGRKKIAIALFQSGLGRNEVHQYLNGNGKQLDPSRLVRDARVREVREEEAVAYGN